MNRNPAAVRSVTRVSVWLVLWALPTGAAGQTLAERVASAPDGAARFSYPTRPGVAICDHGIRVDDAHRIHRRHGSWGREGLGACRPGPAVVEIGIRQGRVRSVALLDLEEQRRGVEEGTALGSSSAAEAVSFLEWVVRAGGSGDAREDAVFPMVLAELDAVWAELLALARDRRLDADARKAALFWLGQEAADAVTAELSEVAADEDEDQEVRDAAVFALSQRPDREGIPHLMEVARSAAHPATRRSALFWLAQDDSEEVVEFFAEILRGG